MANICSVCLNIEQNLQSISQFDAANINLIDKLKSCVPEIDWINDFDICFKCSGQLEDAFNFRNVCIKLQDERIKIWKRIKDEAESTFDEVKIKNEYPLILTEAILTEEKIKNTFTCFHCKSNFKNKTFLARHIKTEHKKCGGFSFNQCKKIYTSEILKKKEEVDCTPRKNEVGDDFSNELEKKFEDKQDVKIEQNLVDANKCDLCTASFNNKYLLKRHRKNVHATEKNFKCDLCPSSFVSPVYLNAHKKYHSGDRKHVCLFCGKRYITASDLYHHEKIHANKRAYVCTECKKSFNTSSDLHKHKICVHLDRNLWKYSCGFCERKFPLKVNLDTHIKTHTGEKNFSCHLCEKKCISRSALTRHIDSHTNVRSFKCTICDSGYKYQKSLDIHMVKNHGIGDIKVPEREKKFFCHMCPKSYYANSKLQKHFRSHTGDKPFKCPNCDKCFVDKSYVKQHLKVAHNYIEA